VILPLLLGALAGLGAVVSWRLIFPPSIPLQAAIDRLHQRTRLAQITTSDQGDDLSDVLGRTLGASLERLLRSLGLRFDRVDADLRLTGRTLEQHLAQKVLLAIFGLTLPVLVGLMWIMVGIDVSITLPAAAGIALAAVFFFAPDLALRSEADDRRTQFRHALGSFLDLVVISLAGGAGVESALRDAAGIGRGWAYAQLRNALDVTTLTGETPWAALARLGDEVGVSELSELAASISLAGTEGARVRDSLAMKASTLREHAMAEAEAEAESTTEKMAVPVVLLFLGFMILIGYPAFDAVMTTL
jgi:Flp pilus assembly protein TadB